MVCARMVYPCLTKQPDAPWDFMHVFTEIKSELAAERDKKVRRCSSSRYQLMTHRAVRASLG